MLEPNDLSLPPVPPTVITGAKSSGISMALPRGDSAIETPRACSGCAALAARVAELERRQIVDRAVADDRRSLLAHARELEDRMLSAESLIVQLWAICYPREDQPAG